MLFLLFPQHLAQSRAQRKPEGVCGEGWEVRGGDTLARPRVSPGPPSPGLTGGKLRVVGVGGVGGGGAVMKACHREVSRE